MLYVTLTKKVCIVGVIDTIVFMLILYAAFVFADDVDGYPPPTDRIQDFGVTKKNVQQNRPASHESHSNFDYPLVSDKFQDPKTQTDHHVARNEDEFFGEDMEAQTTKIKTHGAKSDEPMRNRTSRPKDETFGIYNFTHFPSYDEMRLYMQQLSRSYSDFVGTFNIGKSFEGRNITGIKISSGPGEKPILLIDGGMHAREWISPTTALYAARQFIKNRSRGYFTPNIDIYIIPLMNPDGYEYSRTSEKNRMWRKNRSVHSSSCRGVDLNRNFVVGWGGVGASKNPCSFQYAGPKPFSEPETQALRNFFEAHDNLIKVHLSLHSHLSAILYPWGTKSSSPPKNELTLKCLAKKASEELAKHRKSHYSFGSILDVVGGSSGSSIDWSMSHGWSSTSFAFELPNNSYGFRAPKSEIIPVGDESFRAFTVFAQFVEDGLCSLGNKPPKKKKPGFTRPTTFDDRSDVQDMAML